MTSMYLTVEEYKRVPTALNTSNLDYFSGIDDNLAQDIELANIIERASAWINNYCSTPEGFQSSEITEVQTVLMNRYGLLRLRPKNIPVAKVSEVKYRYTHTSGWTTVDNETIQRFDRYIEVPLMVSDFSGVSNSASPLQSYLSPIQRANIEDIPVTVQYTYESGYPHTILASEANAGEMVITLEEESGVKAGTVLTIFDGVNQERVKIAEDPTGPTVTLKQPLRYSHSIGTATTALPADIKQACILLVNYLLKERGVNSITLEGVTNPLMQKYDDIRDVKLAKEILRGYKRAVI